MRKFAAPYHTNADLPLTVKAHLPPNAQDIFRKTFKGAWRNYAKFQASQRETIAFRVAWATVRRRYRKSGGLWIKK
jgi:cation transport regulator